MKKLILSVILLLTVLPAFPLFTGQLEAQTKGPLTCDEFKKISKTAECKYWIARIDEKGMWCGKEEGDLYIGDEAAVYKDRPPDYTLAFGTECITEKQDQSTTSQTSGPFNIFSINPLETWRNIQGILNIPEGLNSLVQTAEILSGPTEIKIQIPEPSISTDDQGNPWDFLSGYIPPEEGKISIISGQGQIKPPDSYQFIPVINTGNSSEMVTYTFLGSTFKNSDSDVVQFRYIWDTNSGAVINVFPQAEVQFVKPASGEAVKEAKRTIMLNKGEIEVKEKNDNPENKFGIKTEFLDLIVIGTHFWVSHDLVAKQTIVGVYDGEVEVKTKDGKTTTVVPNGDKPGIIVVAQKLSVTKLAVIGVVLTAIVGGVVLILRKRFSSKSFRKRK